MSTRIRKHGKVASNIDQIRPWPSKTQSCGAFTQPRGECWHHNQKATYRGGRWKRYHTVWGGEVEIGCLRRAHFFLFLSLRVRPWQIETKLG